MIDRLTGATESYLRQCGIAAPLMVVRGDGALIAADLTRTRPIETILSGSAASLVGAHHLTGAADAVVSDIGGITTDVAILQDGLPRIDPGGAVVGGFRTMVEAVAMRTFSLGGNLAAARGGPVRARPGQVLAARPIAQRHAAAGDTRSPRGAGDRAAFRFHAVRRHACFGPTIVSNVSANGTV